MTTIADGIVDELPREAERMRFVEWIATILTIPAWGFIFLMMASLTPLRLAELKRAIAALGRGEFRQ